MCVVERRITTLSMCENRCTHRCTNDSCGARLHATRQRMCGECSSDSCGSQQVLVHRIRPAHHLSHVARPLHEASALVRPRLISLPAILGLGLDELVHDVLRWQRHTHTSECGGIALCSSLSMRNMMDTHDARGTNVEDSVGASVWLM